MKHQNHQFSQLLKRARSHTRALAVTSLSDHAAWILSTSVFIPSVKYSLGLCHLSDLKLHQLQGPYHCVFLQKLELSQQTPRILCFAPRS